MKIGMMIDRYKPHVSGVTNYVAISKKSLEAAGHEVYVFTFGDEDYADDEPNIIRSPGIPLVDTGYYLSLRYNRTARRLLYSMEVAHVHHPFLSGSLAHFYCHSRGIPIIFTNHTRYDLYTQAYFPILPESVGETAMRAYLPNFCRGCDLVVAPSQGMKTILEKFGVDAPIEVIPNGVDLTPLQKEIQPVSREPLGIGPQDVILMYVGRLGPEKNLPFLLRAFAGAAEAYSNIYLMIVGDGPERENLVDRVKLMELSARIHFTGMIPYERLPEYLAMADAFVTASVTEVHPLSVIEAMATGLPVLGIHSPGISDTIEDGKTGYLASEDIAAFTAKMIRLATEQNKRKEMGQAARIASDSYNIQHTTQLMIQQYKQVIQQGQNRKQNWRTRMTRLLDRWN